MHEAGGLFPVAAILHWAFSRRGDSKRGLLLVEAILHWDLDSKVSLQKGWSNWRRRFTGGPFPVDAILRWDLELKVSLQEGLDVEAILRWILTRRSPCKRG